MVSMATHYAILKNEGLLTKTHISAATHPRKSNLASIQFLYIVLYPIFRYEKLSSVHNHEF